MVTRHPFELNRASHGLPFHRGVVADIALVKECRVNIVRNL